jgi:Flp pilus assembly protein CpaB
VLAAATALLLHGHLTRLSAEAAVASPRSLVDVVLAAVPIQRGTSLEDRHLRTTRMPRAYVPPGSIDRIVKAAGRVTLSALAPGEVVTDTRLARVRAGPVASLVPEGLRAFAVPTSLPPGAVAAGDHVDILATYTSGRPYTETVVEGVEVLAVLGPGPPGAESALDLDVSSGDGEALTLIVLVAPQQQERMAFARAFASVEVTVAPPSG